MGDNFPQLRLRPHLFYVLLTCGPHLTRQTSPPRFRPRHTFSRCFSWSLALVTLSFPVTRSRRNSPGAAAISSSAITSSTSSCEGGVGRGRLHVGGGVQCSDNQLVCNHVVHILLKGGGRGEGQAAFKGKHMRPHLPAGVAPRPQKYRCGGNYAVQGPPLPSPPSLRHPPPHTHTHIP